MLSIPDTFNQKDFAWSSVSQVDTSLSDTIMCASLLLKKQKNKTVRPRKRKRYVSKLKPIKTKKQKINPQKKQKKKKETKTKTTKYDDNLIIVNNSSVVSYPDMQTVTAPDGREMIVPRRQNRKNSKKLIIVEDKDLRPYKKYLKEGLIKFYENTDYIYRLVFPLAEELHVLSLCVLHYAVTTYCPMNNIKYIIDDKTGKIYDFEDTFEGYNPKTCRLINVTQSYDKQLKKYTKRNFAPCRRHDRTPWIVPNGSIWITTLSQPNFLRWCIQIKFIYWCLKNRHKILDSSKEEKKNKKKNKNKKKIKSPDQGTKTHSNCVLVYKDPRQISVIKQIPFNL